MIFHVHHLALLARRARRGNHSKAYLVIIFVKLVVLAAAVICMFIWSSK